MICVFSNSIWIVSYESRILILKVIFVLALFYQSKMIIFSINSEEYLTIFLHNLWYIYIYSQKKSKYVSLTCILFENALKLSIFLNSSYSVSTMGPDFSFNLSYEMFEIELNYLLLDERINNTFYSNEIYKSLY